MKKYLKVLLDLKDKSQTDIAPHFSMTKQSFNNKMRNADTRFNLSDLVKLAELTDTHLAFIDNKTGKELISFDVDDIKTESKNDNK